MRFLVMAALIVWGGLAQAADCTSPTGVPQQFQFIAGNGFHFCENTGAWVRLVQTNTFVPCTRPDGAFFYRSPNMIGCLSGMEHVFDATSAGACSVAETGKWDFNGGDSIMFCNGTDWMKGD